MSLSQLTVVPNTPETPAARAHRLLAEAREAAGEQVAALEQALATVAGLATEIAEGGEAYSPGVRDLCRRLVEDTHHRVQTLDALLQHARPAPRR
jgi:hypothetical protein